MLACNRKERKSYKTYCLFVSFQHGLVHLGFSSCASVIPMLTYLCLSSWWHVWLGLMEVGRMPGITSSNLLIAGAIGESTITWQPELV